MVNFHYCRTFIVITTIKAESDDLLPSSSFYTWSETFMGYFDTAIQTESEVRTLSLVYPLLSFLFALTGFWMHIGKKE